MAETYCGKPCAECKEKEILSCPGCKSGPGRPKAHGGDCRLAQCCREKGHWECATCGHNKTCTTLRGKQYMPEYRLKAIESQKMIAAEIAKRAPVLGKWLWVLFWLIIPDTLASFMTNDTIVGWFPGLYIPGQMLTSISVVIYGIILLRLTSEEERYRTAGICTLACGFINGLMCIPGVYGEIWWMLIFALLLAIIAPIGLYHEFTAHSVVLAGLDDELAEKWSVLWKWHIGMYLTVLLGGLIPLIGLLAVLAASVGMAVVSIVKLVYLYKTAKLFKEYPSKGYE